MKKFIAVLFLLLFPSFLLSQWQYESSFNLKTSNQTRDPEYKSSEINLKLRSKENTGISNGLLKAGLILFPFNPILLTEDKKFYAGFTKEISYSKFPYGRIALEYSLIVRETKLNHLRASYNFDIPLETGDFFAFLISVGGGYFTDFDKEGYFPQASLSLLLPFSDEIGSMPYIKFRHTFMNDKSKSDISDFSLGLGLYISFL